MPRLVETKHIKHRILRVGNGAFFVVSNIVHQPFGIAPEGLFFFAVGPFGPAAFFISLSRGGWLREFNKNPKKEPNMANRNTNPGISESAYREFVDILCFATCR